MGERVSSTRGAGTLKRRGLLAGAAALVATGLAKLAGPGQVEATHGSPPAGAAAGIDTAALHVGRVQGATNETLLIASSGSSFTGAQPSRSFAILTSFGRFGLNGSVISAGVGSATTGFPVSVPREIAGVLGTAIGASPGVRGESTAGVGVFGVSQVGAYNASLSNPYHVAPPSGQTGVAGVSDVGTGVRGDSGSGVGVIGISRDAAGMYGFSSSGVGVFGTSPTNVGLFGQGSQNAGVFGVSPVYGVWGRTDTGLGVRGEAVGAGIGVYGRAGTNGWAGYFLGNVYVTGTITQGGMASPQAASAQTVESFGEGQLVNGTATILLEQDAAEAVGGKPYHVFLTEIGDHNALFVAGQGPKGFEVRAKGAPTANSRFHYRVVAKRTPGRRQAAGTEAMPLIALPKDVPVPTAPELPKIDELRRERQGRPEAR